MAAARDNEIALEALLSRSSLPAPTIVPSAEAVRVVVADPDDLSMWHEELGGEIHIGPSVEGSAVWTLHTSLPRPHARPVPVLVSVVVVDGEAIMDDLRAAVVSDVSQPVSGPFRISVERIPTGVTLDLRPFVEAVLVEVFTEHPDAVADILDEQADARPYDGHRPESLLVERLLAEVSTRVPVYGQQCLALAESIRAAAGLRGAA
ncbi:hypothetical protein CP973_07100 [Streptomyces albofaciens JCM 4342]|uniref:hypothetical protein n=1 Tax=Streptomyces albofaciens TaxID=66866 RepID=UPI00123B27B5|nr:hypothetical protein [Streptomyces albofaciens]KAA6221762.1 hypothetical protein CP973_07100 [Streptomyces albofaciens JCM 4342]